MSKSLKTLDLSYNELDMIPFAALKELRNLQWINLHGSVYVRDLNLAFNDINTLVNESFNGLQCGRIILSHNQVYQTETDTFAGLETTLEFLDFDHNDLTQVPEALSSLKSLKYLYLSSNSIADIPPGTFDGFCPNLKALSLAGNHLTRIPNESLQNCSKISHFNVAYNRIYDLHEQDFTDWGYNIRNLILGNNRISSLKAKIFNGLKELKELTLSFNPIKYFDENVFEGLDKLESLELSFGLEMEKFPEQIFKHIPSLQWLSVDNNELPSISTTFLSFLPQLKYINLESNRIRQIPPKLLVSSLHNNLKDARFSNNDIVSLRERTFDTLHSLESVMLASNRISIIHKNAFYNLPNLNKIILSDNEISEISYQAFSNLPKLHKLDLHNNILSEFSFSYFANVSHPIFLNMSRNRISSCSAEHKILNIEVLDFTQNNLGSIPSCIESIALLKRLFFDYNSISSLEHNSLMHLTSLEILSLKSNNIININRRAFFGLQNLQVLDLSHNQISQLHINQFSSMPKLRILNLCHNNINYLPKDIFSNTILERLDLSYNIFSVIPTSSLTDIGLTLRHFSINSNNVEHIDSTTFPDIPFQFLDLSNNKFTILPDNVFTSLGLLQKLHLNSNQIRANFKEVFHYAQNLKELSMASSGIISTPTLPLPNLIYLNLSHNNIENINRNTVQKLGKLKCLDLSYNSITHIPAHLWIHLPHLKTLDLSYNPIKVSNTYLF
ncbi:hypothetical protein MML48_1g15684 [Holotrichia oblita]|uniref:Uncharacterized protein n=1 Tax=Holotrichia oblita TaxID=644536 RepID=A0ACB9TSD7_HOLOL|nr:hypothetical protein MML48_1g15684 [Holotrichia oblita]